MESQAPNSSSENFSSDKKKLLALDGGGIRGMITVEVLAEIEAMLRKQLNAGDDFVLADYFDYVAGTSTGAIIATCVAWGMPVAKIREFYLQQGEQMFDRASLIKRLRYKYDDEPLARALKREFGAQTTLGTDKLKTLLMVVLRNATTDSPWPVSNNPGAKYNARDRDDCNLKLPLWKIVRASTAAPTYFPPEVVTLGSEKSYDFIFVDGGVTPYNNPAFILFLMATVDAYNLRWATGVDDMLLVSVGTGLNPNADDGLRAGEMNLLYNASTIPSALMFAASNEQDVLCRVFGRCRAGDAIDREINDLASNSGIAHRDGALPKLFTYMRYNAELTEKGLADLGLATIRPEDVRKMDSTEHIDKLQRIGRAVGKKRVQAGHFDGFLA